jgi:hypothetical protein
MFVDKNALCFLTLSITVLSFYKYLRIRFERIYTGKRAGYEEDEDEDEEGEVVVESAVGAGRGRGVVCALASSCFKICAVWSSCLRSIARPSPSFLGLVFNK